MKKLILSSMLLLGLAATQVQAQTLVYKPKNPSFGGNTFNYSWLLSGAQAQDTYKDPEAEDPFAAFNFGDPLSDFTENLNRQLLSRISQELFASQFGDAGLAEGTYTLGGFQVEVKNTTEGVAITILDTTTGGQTQVIVPFF